VLREDAFAVVPNSAPVLDAIGNKTVNEGQLLSFTVHATDPNGQPVTYSLQAVSGSLPAGISFNTTTGAFSWTPSYTQSGSYELLFTATDGELTDAEQITVTVVNINTPPVLDPIGNKSVNEGQLLSFTIHATDPNGDTVTYSLQAASGSLPAGISFNITTGAFSWTPSYSQSGSYGLIFGATDGVSTDIEQITVTVNNVSGGGGGGGTTDQPKKRIQLNTRE